MGKWQRSEKMGKTIISRAMWGGGARIPTVGLAVACVHGIFLAGCGPIDGGGGGNTKDTNGGVTKDTNGGGAKGTDEGGTKDADGGGTKETNNPSIGDAVGNGKKSVGGTDTDICTPRTGQPQPSQSQIGITSTSGWQQTSMSLRQGDRFEVRYSEGDWTVDCRNYPYAGPEGHPPDIDAQIYQDCRLVESLPYGTLIGQVGNGSIFAVGEGDEFTADASGALSLRINDDDACLVDNDGELIVDEPERVTTPDTDTAKKADSKSGKQGSSKKADSKSGKQSSTNNTDVSSCPASYEADWSSGRDGWVGSSEWKYVGGMMVNDGSSSYGKGWISAPCQPKTPDYAVEAEIQLIPPDSCRYVGQEFGLAARADERGGILGGFSCYNDGLVIASTDNPFSFTSERDRIDAEDFTLDDEWHVYRLEVRGNRIRLLMDGAPILEGTDNRRLDSGKIGMFGNDLQINVRSFRFTEL
jgi:hypothetical protein